MPQEPLAPPQAESSVRRPIWWDEAVVHLTGVTPVFGPIIQASQAISWREPQAPFPALARAILGQQISVAAAQGIWRRLLAGLAIEDGRDLVPHQILRLSAAELRPFGISMRKAETLLELAQQFEQKGWSAPFFESRSDEEIVADLSAIRGIGRWTAEMFLLFTLHRQDVMPLGDLGFRQAVQDWYPDASTVQKIRDCIAPWRPFGSAATWCLWQYLRFDREFQNTLRQGLRR